MSKGKHTPLFPAYEKEGAKTVDFGGWEMPVQFSSIKEEHYAVRNQAGLFDVSHMGEARVKGPDALALLQRVMTNDVSKLTPDRAQYTLMCNKQGGTVDDLLIYHLAENDYFLVLNAANQEKDIAWIKEHIQPEDDVEVTDVSDDYALLAVQGPVAEGIVQKLADLELSEIRFFRFRQQVKLGNVKGLISRTGYTGEDGFEIYCAAEDAYELWEALLEAGRGEGLVPCGLGARDTLRFEARLPLYGQEITETISPLEAGLGFAVKLDKDTAFTGQKALKKQKEEGLTRKLVGIQMVDKGIPRTDYSVHDQAGNEIGHVTTGTQSPTLGENVGLALVDIEHTNLEQPLWVQVRKKRLKAVVRKTPFYKRM
ncbi:glycine cleavage system aminomethyltransferase GcvT [Salsuginibacillus kocurii]|uniref:glycine cleavage system aminomethyltransferase GcvT n=1 Tax=Salsuginibacillus kocurii TaxID=427078 RepID=UPI000368011A|nr:glycine cleavage system aminomethyltransferase GcvT [Salsuginibacillus kocurii]